MSQDSRDGQTSRPSTPSPRELAGAGSHINTPSAAASYVQHPTSLTAGVRVPAAASSDLSTSSPPVSVSYGGGLGGSGVSALPMFRAAQAGSA